MFYWNALLPVPCTSASAVAEFGVPVVEALERVHVLEPAASLLGISCQADAVKELVLCALFLASRGAGYLTGQSLGVNGGLYTGD